MGDCGNPKAYGFVNKRVAISQESDPLLGVDVVSVQAEEEDVLIHAIGALLSKVAASISQTVICMYSYL